jgi:hypothetical protein
MAGQLWLYRLAGRLMDLSVIRRRRVIVLWRLHRTAGAAETVCSFTEPSPNLFDVLLTSNERLEIRRVVHGIDRLMVWSDGVKARLEADGWRDVWAPEASRRIPGRTRDDRSTVQIGEAHERHGAPSPKMEER